MPTAEHVRYSHGSPDYTFNNNKNHSKDSIIDETRKINYLTRACSIIPMRVLLAILGFWGYINFYAMRVNLSVAIVAMVRQRSKDVNGTNGTLETCPELIEYKNISGNQEMSITMGEFDWDSEIQGQILGSFFYGYLITQIPGGVIAEKHGAKWIVGLGILITAICTLLTPVAARWSVWALMAARIIEGLASGAVCPAMNCLISRWVPKNERSRINTAICIGIMIGTVITNSVTGVICESTALGGWPAAFYIFGCIGCVWFILWSFLVYETPELHPFLTEKELIFIQQNNDKIVYSSVKVPWKSIFTSIPMWALILAHFGHNWAFYTLLTMTPTYLSNVLHFELKNNGLMSGLPWLMMAVFSVTASFIADYLRTRGRLHITSIRKLMTSIALFGPGICVLSIGFINCNPVAIMVLLCLSYGLNGLVYSGIIVNHVDMSPQFAGTLFGITNGIATLPGFMAPTLIGAILKSSQSLNNWKIIFSMTSAIYFIVGIIYDIFASAELQPWNFTHGRVSTDESETSPVSHKERNQPNLHVKYSCHKISKIEKSEISEELNA